MPTTALAPGDGRRGRATWPSPQPTSRIRRQPASSAVDDREDLELVLGVGPVGEGRLPPLRVLVPEPRPGPVRGDGVAARDVPGRGGSARSAGGSLDAGSADAARPVAAPGWRWAWSGVGDRLGAATRGRASSSRRRPATWPDAAELGDEPVRGGSGPRPGMPSRRARAHPLAPQLAVEGDREPVRLVPDLLEQVDRRRSPGGSGSARRAGDVDLLELLGERRRARSARSRPSSSSDRIADAELALAAVEQEELGRVGEARSGVPSAGSVRLPRRGGGGAGQDLVHRAVVVVALHRGRP